MWDRHDPERLEQRIRVERDGSVTALSGKIEFGQGIRTAFAQIVADELDIPIERVNVVLGDTDQVPFDFGTFGSHSVAQETPLLRKAAAFARQQLIDRASAKLGLPAEKLDTDAGVVVGGGKRVPYAELLDSELDGTSVHVGDSVVRFLPGGPQGRPQLQAELLI